MTTTMTREIDPAKMLRGSIGFDRIADMLDMALQSGSTGAGFPAYNITKTDDDTYNVSLAVAGFAQEDLEIEQHQSVLIVTGTHEGSDEGAQFLHRGIAGRGFKRRFQLAEHVRVTGAKLADGILSIDMTREVPEAQRPKSIPIGTDPAQV
jgi:molecular chaperone IbpA